MRLCLATLLALAGTGTMAAQNELQHHNFSLGLGPAMPAGNSKTYLGTAPMFAFSYGYRFNRFLQADAGLQLAWGAARNQNAVVTDLGQVQGGDHEYMIPLGGRVILPLPFKRLEISAGGGAAWLHYSETAPSNGYYQNSCYSCTSRGGWGGYGLGEVKYFVDSSRTFHVGTTVQYISAKTSGEAVGNIPAFSTTDHWTNIIFGAGLRF